MAFDGNILALSGGVGGAKLALGLSRVLSCGQLTIVANTADDFEHFGLHIAPDLDTVMYTLAGLANRELGWGLQGESWTVLEALENLGADSWFKLGDRDLATHLWRTAQLHAGLSLSDVTTALCQRLNIDVSIVPMSDDPVRTVVHSDEGDLSFQHYFVRRRCEPQVHGFSFVGLDSARPSAALLGALQDPQLRAIVICPSNPFVSVDPILSLGGVRELIAERGIPVLAVSPIVAGLAIKGPAAKMMAELSMPVTALAVAQHYGDLLSHFVVDESDAGLLHNIQRLGINASATKTIMKTLDDREALAGYVLQQVKQQ